MRKHVITEARIREIIQEEIAIQQLLEEGFLDSAKDAIKKLSVAVTNRFKEAADKWANVISEKINMMQTIPPEILTIVNALEPVPTLS